MKYQNPLTDAQRKLVEENLGLVAFALKKIPVGYFDSREDAYQIGSIGLMKAARSYDPEKRVLFATYAMPCILNELRMALRHINCSCPAGKVCSYDADIPSQEGEAFSLLDVVPSDEPLPETRMIARETLSRIVSALKAMPDRDAYPLLRMIVQNRTQKEIAAALGITQSAVSRKLQRIRISLQPIMQI